MGPDNVGGRTRAVLIDKDNPSKSMQVQYQEDFVSESRGEPGENIDELANQTFLVLHKLQMVIFILEQEKCIL